MNAFLLLYLMCVCLRCLCMHSVRVKRYTSANIICSLAADIRIANMQCVKRVSGLTDGLLIFAQLIKRYWMSIVQTVFIQHGIKGIFAFCSIWTLEFKYGNLHPVFVILCGTRSRAPRLVFLPIADHCARLAHCIHVCVFEECVDSIYATRDCRRHAFSTPCKNIETYTHKHSYPPTKTPGSHAIYACRRALLDARKHTRARMTICTIVFVPRCSGMPNILQYTHKYAAAQHRAHRYIDAGVYV